MSRGEEKLIEGKTGGEEKTTNAIRDKTNRMKGKGKPGN